MPAKKTTGIKNKIIKTELVEWENLKLFQPDSLKKMTQSQMNKLKTSLKTNGVATPFYVWKNKNTLWCLDGHIRIPVMKILKDEGETIPAKLPANFIDCKNKKEAKKCVLIYNSHYANILEQELADWIQDLDFEDLKTEIDISNINFNSLESLLLNETANDDVVRDFDYNITKTGDVWELGRHRVVCGDSTKIKDVEKLLNGNKVDMVFTDPPYGVNYALKNENLNRRFAGDRIQTPYLNDDLEDYEKWFVNWLKNIPFAEYNTIYIWINGMRLRELLNAIKLMNINTPITLIWVKNNHVMANTDYLPRHEICIYGWKGKHKFYGKTPSTILEFSKPLANNLHPTMKPIDLILQLITHGSKKNDIVMDLFLGSGSTLIASEKTNRICYGIEIDPHYCDVIVKRYYDWCIENNKKYSIKLNGQDLTKKQWQNIQKSA